MKELLRQWLALRGEVSRLEAESDMARKAAIAANMMLEDLEEKIVGEAKAGSVPKGFAVDGHTLMVDRDSVIVVQVEAL